MVSRTWASADWRGTLPLGHDTGDSGNVSADRRARPVLCCAAARLECAASQLCASDAAGPWLGNFSTIEGIGGMIGPVIGGTLAVSAMASFGALVCRDYVCTLSAFSTFGFPFVRLRIAAWQ